MEIKITLIVAAAVVVLLLGLTTVGSLDAAHKRMSINECAAKTQKPVDCASALSLK